tara:strand:+ start:303 stop:983 length:681 start_codon:yes stop_codon:yes gene_type:complete
MIHDIASIIRAGVESIGATPMDNEYPEIKEEGVYIKNEMWKYPGMRKIHLETGSAKGMNVLHCVWYPDPEYNLPIFGCDVVDTGTTITAAIVDISPVRGTEEIYKLIQPVANNFHFSERRPLPLWGDEIFSPACKFMRINKEIEKANYYCLVMNYLMIYCDEIVKTEKDPNWVNTMLRLDDQVYYCTQQKKNKKTLAVLSKWFSRDWAEQYIDTILFDEPVMKVSV